MRQFDFSGEVGGKCAERRKIDDRDTDQNGDAKVERLGDQCSEATAFDLGLSKFAENQEIGPAGQPGSGGFTGAEQPVCVQDTAPGMRPPVVGYAVELACRKIKQMHVAFHTIRFRLA